MKAPILSPSFVWIPSATHDAGSDAFRQRQLARIAATQQARVDTNVKPIKQKVKS